MSDDEAIIKACKEGDTKTISDWIGSENFDWKKEFQWQDSESVDLKTPAIFIAIDYKQMDVIEALLLMDDEAKKKKGCDINMKDSNDYSPLTWASMNGSKDIIDVLLENGAKVDQDAIDQAKENGYDEIHKLLRSKMDWYADLDPNDLDEIMIKASREGDVAKVKELIEQKGYDMSKWKKEGDEDGGYKEYSPIFVALKNGHIDVIREFLEAGVEAELIETHFNYDDNNDKEAAAAIEAAKEKAKEPLSQEQMEALREQLEKMP